MTRGGADERAGADGLPRVDSARPGTEAARSPSPLRAVHAPDDDPLDLRPDDAIAGELTPEQLAARTADLTHTVREVRARACAGCSRALCGHEAVLNVVLGSRHAARCRTCLGSEHREDPTALAERALAWIRRRACFLHVWHDAGEHEHGARQDRPACLFARGPDADPAAAHETADETVSADEAPRAEQTPRESHRHDAGDQGCGDLVLELRNVLRGLAPGDVLHVTATDPAAPIDLPAWCGLTGHTLLRATHPDYWIRRRSDR